jgi:hypothetical protein
MRAVIIRDITGTASGPAFALPLGVKVLFRFISASHADKAPHVQHKRPEEVDKRYRRHQRPREASMDPCGAVVLTPTIRVDSHAEALAFYQRLREANRA